MLPGWLLAAVVVVTHCTPAPSLGQPARKGTARKAAAAPVMSPETLAAVHAAAAAKSQNIIGIDDRGRDGFGLVRLQIRSTRIDLILRMVSAANEGGKYLPTARERRDLVSVDCGQSDYGKEFNCRFVRVTDPDGKLVPALTHVAETNAYQNGFGAKWTVQEVSATFPAAPLANGFTVNYVSSSGVEFEKVVTAREAERELMLRIEPPVP